MNGSNLFDFIILKLQVTTYVTLRVIYTTVFVIKIFGKLRTAKIIASENKIKNIINYPHNIELLKQLC